MPEQILTSVRADVDQSHEAELLDGFREMTQVPMPHGLLRTELLHSQDGSWRIQSLWRDREALIAARNSGDRPAALALFDRLGADHMHEVFTVTVAHQQPDA